MLKADRFCPLTIRGGRGHSSGEVHSQRCCKDAAPCQDGRRAVRQGRQRAGEITLLKKRSAVSLKRKAELRGPRGLRRTLRAAAAAEKDFGAGKPRRQRARA